MAELECPRERLRFPVLDGIPQLVTPDRANAIRVLAEEYSRVWQKDGWGSSSPSYLLNLPNRDTTGRQSGKWRVKARSMDALLRLFRRLTPRRVLDLGCGVGWLSYGLRAAEAYMDAGVAFERVWAELERLPFLSGTFDAVICNASLHYSTSLGIALAEASRVLRPSGIFVVMNSPVYIDSRSAEDAERSFRRRLLDLGASQDLVSRYHHLVRSKLEASLTAAVGAPRHESFDPGRTFRLVRYIKGHVLRMELASFPMIWAQKRTESA